MEGWFDKKDFFARRGAHLAAERSPSVARADGARRSVAVPNGEGVASGSATLHFLLNLKHKIVKFADVCEKV